MRMAKIIIEGKAKEYAAGTTFEAIADEYQDEYNGEIALVKENGKIRELNKTISDDAEVEFITLRHPIGHKTYERSATMLFVKAVSDVVGSKIDGKVKVEFSIGKGIYCSVQGDFKATDNLVEHVNVRMNELVEANMPIVKKTYPIAEAVKMFEEQGMTDKVNLFKYRMSSTVNVYSIGDYYDYYYGYMLPSTGYIKSFIVMAYEEGFLLLLPDKDAPFHLDTFEPREKLFKSMATTTEWGNAMGIGTVGDLNNKICGGELEDIILVQEALQERRIGEIASDIVKRGGVKFVMIAGPSSSGKTTFKDEGYKTTVKFTNKGLPSDLPSVYVKSSAEKNMDDYELILLKDVAVKIKSEGVESSVFPLEIEKVHNGTKESSTKRIASMDALEERIDLRLCS